MPDVTIGLRPNLNRSPQPIAITEAYRRQHCLIVGKTGVGKSNLAMNMAISDFRAGAGLCFVDPNGGAVDKLLEYVPKHRTNQVVYISPADEDFPVGLNFLQPRQDQPNHLVVSEIVSSIRSLFADSWGPQSEFLLGQAASAVMDFPGGTLQEVFRMLIDPAFRSRVVKNIQNPMVKLFWSQVFAKWPLNFQATATAPLVNKLGAFLTNPSLRMMVAQSHSTINLPEVMDSGGIILVNLAAGRIGEDQAGLFGSLFITQLYLTALARRSQPEDQRRDFYLYLEEAENFTTDALPSMLAQARKFRLNLTLSYQFLDQMKDRNRNAISGTVGTLIVFRVRNDSEELEKELRPQFQVDYLRRQQNYRAVYRLQGQGLAALPASTTTLPSLEMPGDEADPATFIRISRERYTRPRSKVEAEIDKRWKITTSPKKKGPQ